MKTTAKEKNFLEKVSQKDDGMYVAMSKYVNYEVPITIKHKLCGKSFDIKPRKFFAMTYPCTDCAKFLKAQRTLQRNKNNFIKKLNAMYPNEYELKGPYVDCHTKVGLLHKCGNYCYISPNNILSRHSICQFCKWKKDRIRRKKEFIKQLDEIHPGEYKLTTDYYNNNTNVTLLHKCGHYLTSTPNTILTGNTQCDFCRRERRRIKDEKRFVKEVNQVDNGDYAVLGKYITRETHILMLHKVCGHQWSTKPYSFINRGFHCPKCSYLNINTKSFVQRLKYKYNGDYKLASDYISFVDKITLKHKCGHKFQTTPQDILGEHSTCNKCKMEKVRLKWQEKFIKDLKILGKDRYVLLSDYINKNKEVKIFHKDCQRVFYVSPKCFVKDGVRCRHCTQKRFEEKMFNRHKRQFINRLNGEYTLESKYKGYKTPICIKHKTCHRKFKTKPKNFVKNEIGCPHCNQEKNHIKQEKYYAQKFYYYFKKYGQDYELCDKYVSYTTPITFLHKVCNRKCKISPQNIVNKGQGCRYCAYELSGQRNIEKSAIEFPKKMKKLEGDDYILTGKYLGRNKKTKILHKKCNREFIMTPGCFLSGERCTFCSQTRGEERIDYLVRKYNLGLKYRHVIKDCKYHGNLHFDFWDEQKRIAIEFDGIQHYQPIDFFGGEQNFKETQKRDAIKNQYCIDNEILLIRIKYNKLNALENLFKNEILPLIKSEKRNKFIYRF